ncbi:hypothetical protein WOC76_04135 [Methylocystis sp. IM3]|jgi:hypothetical protein|uniref:bestrophin-like domain n=1 Tax=unclassified Methylocystis TaxID=2625913 RepID=UPI000FA8E5C6|nr:MAG: hypothetical protein EKK29_22250 [Hyphomicrobiales bacterium]
MSPLSISLVAFLCIFGAAIAGIFLKEHLPDHFLSEESRTIIKAARGVVVGLAALTLGLLIATAKGSFDLKETELKDAAAKMIALSHLLHKYGNQAEKAQASLRRVARGGIEVIEKTARSGLHADDVKGTTIDDLLTDLIALPEQNASQTWVKNSALSLGNEIATSRWKIYQRSSSTVSPLFLAVLVFWLMTIFFSLGLISPFNAAVVSALFTASLSMTGAILLTLELDQPYGGLIKMTTEPLKMALQQFK